MTSAAATAVLSTTELCEMVLLNLPIQDLLRSRQVNQFLRSVIKGSKYLSPEYISTAYRLHTKISYSRSTLKSSMAATPSSAACTAVFQTTELCEMILQNLSFDDLLHSRQVNHFWQDVIGGSKSLQQNLFFLPKHVKEHEPNPLFERVLSAHGWRIMSSSYYMGYVWDVLVIATADRHPSLRIWMPECFGEMLLCQSPCLLRLWMRAESEDDLEWRWSMDWDVLPNERLRTVLAGLESGGRQYQIWNHGIEDCGPRT